MGTLDTLQIYEDLISAHLSEQQAKAILGAIKVAQESWLERLATKEDINNISKDLETKATKVDLDIKIANLRGDLKGDIANVEADLAEAKSSLIRWMFGFFVGQIVALVSIVSIVIRFLK